MSGNEDGGVFFILSKIQLVHNPLGMEREIRSVTCLHSFPFLSFPSTKQIPYICIHSFSFQSNKSIHSVNRVLNTYLL